MQPINIINGSWKQGVEPKVVNLTGTAFMEEAGAHKFVITAQDESGAEIPFTGTISALFLRADNTTVAIDGTINSGKAEIVLVADCYHVAGRFSVAIYVSDGTDSACVYAAVGNIYRTSSDVVIDSGAEIPTLAQLQAAYQACIEATAQATNAVSYETQTGKTDAQKATARENIGAASEQDVSDLRGALIEYDNVNLFDKANAKTGYQINGGVGDTEILYANADRVVTDLIPCTQGDTFYITRIDLSGAFGAIANSNFVSAVALDSDGKILQRGDWVNGFSVTVVAKYVRFCITTSVYNSNKIINITKNYYPVSKKCVDTFGVYKVNRNNVNRKIIDLWGDSRIENGSTENTDVGYYLQNLINANVVQTPTFGILYDAPGYTVCNNGIGAQASGMVAARLGSNDIYVTLYENQIRATGESLVIALRCSTGQEANFNSWSTQAEKGVPCILCGVHGYLVRSQNTIKFIRSADGNAVTVKPKTKIDVLNKDTNEHMAVLWAGKNDMTLADGYQVNGVIGNMMGMVRALHHDYFIIIGETYDNNVSTYGSGTTLRGYVDEINNWYRTHYLNNFIDIQNELVTNGLTIAGITPTEQDTADIANGFIPSSLMQDETHPNATGREVIATIIYNWMIAKNWI